MVGLHQGRAEPSLRDQFEDFLAHYRPRNFGEVFSLSFGRHVPLWTYPWTGGQPVNPRNGWLEDLDQVPDLLTHFCEQGIKRSRIEEECQWLRRAYAAMAQGGYQPEQHCFIQVIELRDEGQSVYIVTDGNHRLGALAALGHKEVVVERRSRQTVWGREHPRWPQVAAGLYTSQEAWALFRCYFSGVTHYQRSLQPARILEL